MRRISCPRGYKPDPYVICDICGLKVRASSTRMQEWDGFRVCLNEWEPKPWLFKPDPIFPNEGLSIPNARPDPGPNYIDSTLPIDPSNL